MTPHRRYPDKMTSPFVWKSIASTRSLPLGSVEYPQLPEPGFLDRLRQQSQLARRKHNYLNTCPTNVCLLVGVVFVVFYSWKKERVERLRFQPDIYPCFTNQIVVVRKNPLWPLLEEFVLCTSPLLMAHWYILCKMDVCWFSILASFYGR